MKVTVVVDSMTVAVAVLCPTMVEGRMENRSKANGKMIIILDCVHGVDCRLFVTWTRTPECCIKGRSVKAG